MKRLTGGSLFKGKKPDDVVQNNKACKIETNLKKYNDLSKNGFFYNFYSFKI
jgi:hypothetical protein